MVFEKYFSDDRIIHYVLRERAKLAKRRNRRQLLYNVSGNMRQLRPRQDRETEEVLNRILPPRRAWKKLDQKARTNANGQPLNSVDKTIRILQRTVNWYRRHGGGTFMPELAKFCREVRQYVECPCAELPMPTILPSRKTPGHDACRPIAVYPLAAKIAICLTNRYLSEKLDPYFEPSSFAFRMPRATQPRTLKPTHHDAFRSITAMRLRCAEADLWVSECDIQKFFDTVNHAVAKKALMRLVARVNRREPASPVSEAAIRVFKAYLRSYSFPHDVLPLNEPGSGYFARNNIPGGRFEWVQSSLTQQGVYRSPLRARMGVPQGGALSGLIANIMLDRVDKALSAAKDDDLLYARYCDDMIVIHRRAFKCKRYMKTYEAQLRKLKLLPHKPSPISTYDKGFWGVKSKPPYRWGRNGRVPWIGFLGYEVNWRGDVRVRKTSLMKEMGKQYDTVQEVLRVIDDRPRLSRGAVYESVANRLIQMSVGRIRLHNYEVATHELCWVHGFQALSDNKYSRIQMKRLDACRNRLLWRLEKKLAGMAQAGRGQKLSTRERVFYGKPFSYYYHVIELQRSEGHIGTH